MDLQQIEKLVQIIENSSMLEFSIQEGDTKIKMSRRGTMGVPGETAVTIAQTAPAQAEENLADDGELVAVIAAAIAAAEGTTTDGFVVRSIRKVKRNRR